MAETQDRCLEKVTEREFRRIVHESVLDSFTTLGIEVDDPLAMQADFRHLREMRLTMEKVRSRSVVATITILISGILAMAWHGIVSMFQNH